MTGGAPAVKKLLYLLFHRSVFVALSLLSQIAILFVMVVTFSEYTELFYWACILASVLAATHEFGAKLVG